jgi:hypothetical protein
MSPHYRAARDGNKTDSWKLDKRISSACVQRKFEWVIPYGSFFYAFNRLYLPSVYSEWRR